VDGHTYVLASEDKWEKDMWKPKIRHTPIRFDSPSNTPLFYQGPDQEKMRKRQKEIYDDLVYQKSMGAELTKEEEETIKRLSKILF
jgi:hypothetical protein